MNVLIVEDEIIAFEKLKALLTRIRPDINIIGHAPSIEEGIRLIQTGMKIDLAFFDIQLQPHSSHTNAENLWHSWKKIVNVRDFREILV